MGIIYDVIKQSITNSILYNMSNNEMFVGGGVALLDKNIMLNFFAQQKYKRKKNTLAKANIVV